MTVPRYLHVFHTQIGIPIESYLEVPGARELGGTAETVSIINSFEKNKA